MWRLGFEEGGKRKRWGSSGPAGDSLFAFLLVHHHGVQCAILITYTLCSDRITVINMPCYPKHLPYPCGKNTIQNPEVGMVSRSLREVERISSCPSGMALRPLRKFLGGQAWAEWCRVQLPSAPNAVFFYQGSESPEGC